MTNFLRFLLFLVLFAPCFADESWDVHRQLHDNGATESNRVICAFNLSEQYDLSHRILYYVLTIVAASDAISWPVVGALLYSFGCWTAASVHGLKLVGYSVADELLGKPTKLYSNGVHDMDVVGIWAVASVGCLLGFKQVLTMFWRALCSRLGCRDEAPDEWDLSDPKIYLISIGSYFIMLGIHSSVIAMLFENSDEPECRSSTTNELMTSASQLLDPSFNCTYNCFSRELPRGISEITVIPKELFYDHFFLIGLAVVALFVGRAAFEAGFAIWQFIDWEINGYYYPRSEWIARLPRWLTTFIVVVLNEVYLLAYGGGFPSKERAFSIGQWGPWVSVLFCLLAYRLIPGCESSDL